MYTDFSLLSPLQFHCMHQAYQSGLVSTSTEGIGTKKGITRACGVSPSRICLIHETGSEERNTLIIFRVGWEASCRFVCFELNISTCPPETQIGLTAQSSLFLLYTSSLSATYCFFYSLFPSCFLLFSHLLSCMPALSL